MAGWQSAQAIAARTAACKPQFIPAAQACTLCTCASKMSRERLFNQVLCIPRCVFATRSQVLRISNRFWAFLVAYSLHVAKVLRISNRFWAFLVAYSLHVVKVLRISNRFRAFLV